MSSRTAPLPHTPSALSAPVAAGGWSRLKRWSVPALALVVLGLLVANAGKVDWEGAWQALKRYPPGLLLGVLAVSLVSHALYGCFDLIGRQHTRHPLPLWRTWAIAVTSYAGNLNLGSLVGGVALRARLYAKAGLDEASVAQIVGISLATNWLGYALVAGSLFAAGAIRPPSQAHLSNSAFHALGFAMIGVVVFYLLACAFATGREWRVRGRSIHLPSWQLALVQLFVASLNWALMGAAMFLLLGQKIDYTTVLAVLMAASIIGLLTPIPAGLGVLEAVYLALLAGHARQGTLLGAVLAYRVLYYLVPLASGLVLYVFLERYAATHAPADAGVDAASSPG